MPQRNSQVGRQRVRGGSCSAGPRQSLRMSRTGGTPCGGVMASFARRGATVKPVDGFAVPRQRLDAPRVFVGGIVDPRADRIGRHVVGRIGRPQPAQLPRILHRRIEPQFIICRGEDHRHAVVDGADQVVGLGRQQRAGLDGRGLGSLPRLPETGEGEGPLVAKVEEVRLFAACRHVATRRSRRPPPGSGGAAGPRGRPASRRPSRRGR